MINSADLAATLSEIGSVSLNISFVIYLIVYIPQIIHNQKVTNLVQLSLWLHLLLYVSYAFDLLYGFSSHLPWQYKTVSVVGLSLVSIQHAQLTRLFINKPLLFQSIGFVCVFIMMAIVIFCFFICYHGTVNPQTTLVFGSIARFCGFIYCLPQLIKNAYLKTSAAISTPFIYLNLSLALLDTISAWCLDWGWPNKLAAPASIFLMMVMLWQIKHYGSKRPPFQTYAKAGVFQ